jgi:hypothetical protein
MQWTSGLRVTLGSFVLLVVSLVLLGLMGLWLFIPPDFPKGQMYSTLVVCAGSSAVFLVASSVLIMQNRFLSTSGKIIAVAFVVTWLCIVIMGYALAYHYVGLFDENKVTRDPITCLYFSIVTWTTLGYGDVRPLAAARLIAASEAVVGYLTMAALIGMVSVLFRQIFEKEAGNG